MPEKFDYKKYLASREWAVRKRQVRERANGLCERCIFRIRGDIIFSQPMSSVHHLTYEHIGAEPIEDLQAVCKECHAFLSAETDFDPRAGVMDVVAAHILTELQLPEDWLKQQIQTIYERWTAKGEKVESLVQLIPPILAVARREGLLPEGEDD